MTTGNDDDPTLGESDATRWYLETDTGSILYGPEAGAFTAVAEGGSLGVLGGTAFHVAPDGSAIRTIRTANEIDVVLTAADLDAERILASGVVRRALFVLVATAEGGAQIWQVPADSPLLATPLFPPAPSLTTWAWVVHTVPGPVTGGAIIAQPNRGPAGQFFAARIDGSNGPVTVLMAAPLALESVCGAGAGGTCVLATSPGNPMGFSPDGSWLLVDDGKRYFAQSTVGRGVFALPDVSPDDATWVEQAGHP
jgi:hypothetical protein